MIISVACAILFNKINPGRQAVLELNARRRSDIQIIADGIRRYQKAEGQLPRSFGTMGKGAVYKINCRQTFDLCDELVPKYLAKMPIDPIFKTPKTTGYSVAIGNELRVVAPFGDMLAENSGEKEISTIVSVQ